MIHIIAAVAENNVIGKDGSIPWNIPADLAHFKALTTGHTIVMGRKTFESIGKVLPDRENIIVSSTISSIDGAIVAASLQKALDLASHEEIFIIGGARLYKEALPLAEMLHITQVHALSDGDTYFPSVNWEVYDIIARKEYDGGADGTVNCTFITYRKIK